MRKRVLALAVGVGTSVAAYVKVRGRMEHVKQQFALSALLVLVELRRKLKRLYADSVPHTVKDAADSDMQSTDDAAVPCIAEECDREFDGEHGMKVHYGVVHETK